MRQQKIVGVDPGQPRIAVAGPPPALGSGREVLPSLEAAASTSRPMWRHPAFVVSMILTLLALIAAGVFVVMALLNPAKGEVTGAAIDVSSGNAHVTWKASGPVDLYVVTNEQAYDLTQLVAGEGEAWVPAGLGLYTRSSCFVVRPAGEPTERVSIDGAVLAEQGAAAVCVGDGAAG